MLKRGCAMGGWILALALSLASCGGGPTSPIPINPQPQPPQQPPANSLPVIDAITIQGSRAKEPANFADLGESVAVSARVHDDESSVDQLEFVWSAGIGTVAGSGPKVTWTAPADAPAADVAINLKVIEKYGAPPIFQHEVTATATASLHNSAKEVGDMARQFLLDFSDSNIRDIPYIMRNFIKGCYGTQDETEQVKENRALFRIVNSRVGPATTTVNFGGVCPYRSRSGDACAAVPVFWDSVSTIDNAKGPPVSGTDWIAAMYQPALGKWGLCDSQFDGRVADSMRGFIR